MKNCRILTNRAEIEALVPQWDALAERTGARLFSRFSTIDVWMQTGGQVEKAHYHIVTVHDGERLTGILPLAVSRLKGFRLLRWAAHEVFLGSLILCETQEDREALWRTALSSPHYDMGKIKYLYADLFETNLITSLPGAEFVETSADTIIDLRPDGGKSWFAGLSRNIRHNYNARAKALAKRGAVTFQNQKSGQIPYDRLTRMLAYKKAWAEQNNIDGTYSLDPAFVMALIKHHDKAGTLLIQELCCENETVAMNVSFVHGDTVYAYITMRHPDWQKESAGFLCQMHSILWAGENGFARFHMMEGGDLYKQRYANTVCFFDTYIWGHTFAGRLALALRRFRRWLRSLKEKRS